MSLKSNILNQLPKPVKWALRFIKRSPHIFYEFFWDAVSYIKFSSVIDMDGDKEKLYAVITATYHNLEKGLSLSSPRPGFGASNINKLVGYLEKYLEVYGPSETLTTPINVLNKYCHFNKAQKVDVSALEEKVKVLARSNNHHLYEAHSKGGVLIRTKEQVVQATSLTTQEFFDYRHSVRQFSDEPVSQSSINLAISVAQKSPVVCNRQSGKVYTILNKNQIIKTLELQGGARGFLSEVTALFCIAVDIRNFNGSGERNQGLIDGGMFAMSFVYGLHLQAIGTCCLNWSKDADEDRKMKAHLGIPASEKIIMFIAAGHLKEKFNVAESVRKPLSTVLVEIR